MFESPVRGPRAPRNRDGAATTLSRDFGRALRAAMRAHVVALGGVPMTYQLGALTVQPLGPRIRVDGEAQSCTVTALFPGVKVRSFSNSPGGWFAQQPAPGYRVDGTAVVCTTGADAREEMASGATSLVLL
ncbi:MAG TPA: hypothetical protein VF092_29555 [Longimicrobium sp.]